MGEEETKKSPESISEDLYKNLIHYFKFASSAYATVCPRPNGKKLITPVSNPGTDVGGFIARDDDRKEIIVSLKGSASITGAVLDAQVLLVPFLCPGCKLPSGIRVHSGFLAAWDSIVAEVAPIVEYQLSSHEGYGLITVGHSLGGSIALLAAVHFKEKHSDYSIKTYSYGAPRTGNKWFADYVNSQFGENAFRVVHGNDGVPTIIPMSLGYHHHGIEYWQREDPSCGKTTVKCDANGEDTTCSASIRSQGINSAHWEYFGILATTPFCL
ncbi:alpha/beta-hydrolase [Crepidotus variabilis]|uniref:Alpha/beta-hydrolase n=1 Tax=Crepidotus variabilis TaxID=179855 RepID=A0A9P6JJ24_9AGAR|nr:alpha/beta-hydrolase [Crepidotus variabilis]